MSLSAVLVSLNQVELNNSAVRAELVPVYQAVQSAAVKLLSERAATPAAIAEPERGPSAA